MYLHPTDHISLQFSELFSPHTNVRIFQESIFVKE